VFRIRIWIRIQESKGDPPKRKKGRNFMFEVLDVLFEGAGGFSCNLKGLRRGIRIKIKKLLFKSKIELFPPLNNLN
jgi:hypothetical protein